MSNKVIHLSDVTHAKMVTYCEKHEIAASTWVEGLILDATQPMFDGEGRLNEHVTKKVIKEVTAVPKKKKLENYDNKSSSEPWALPPFWNNKDG